MPSDFNAPGKQLTQAVQEEDVFTAMSRKNVGMLKNFVRAMWNWRWGQREPGALWKFPPWTFRVWLFPVWRILELQWGQGTKLKIRRQTEAFILTHSSKTPFVSGVFRSLTSGLEVSRYGTLEWKFWLTSERVLVKPKNRLKDSDGKAWLG